MTPGPKIGGIGGSGGNQNANWSFAKKMNELIVSTPNCPRFCRKLPCPVSHFSGVEDRTADNTFYEVVEDWDLWR